MRALSLSWGRVGHIGCRRSIAVALWSSAFMLLSVANAPGQSCIDYRDYMHEVGRVNLSGFYKDIEVAGNRAYLVGGISLRIVDVTSPTSPAIMGQVSVSDDLEVGVHGVAVLGTLAYVAAGSRNLRVVNVSNPLAPVIIGTADTPGIARGVAVAGNYCFLADGVDLKVIDVSSPQVPQIVGNFGTGGVVIGVAVSGMHAYVLSGSTMHVVDVSNPAMPVGVGVGFPGNGSDVVVEDNFAYVATSSGLVVFDVSNPASPAIVGGPLGGMDMKRVAVSGNTVTLADMWSKIHTVDISNPFQPTVVGSFVVELRPGAVAMAGQHAYVFVEGNIAVPAHFLVLDLSNPHSPEPISQTTMPPPGNAAAGVAVAGTQAYVVTSGGLGNRFVAFDVSNPMSPSLRWVVDTPGTAFHVVISDNLAYVADFGIGLLVYDVSLPNPVAIGWIPGSQIRASVVAGNYAYIAAGSSDLLVADVSNPKSPVVVGSASMPGSASNVAVAGNLVYVSDSLLGLTIVDVSNPASPEVLRTSFDIGEIFDLAVEGAYLYIAAGTGLQVVDVSDPSSPFLVAAVETPSTALSVAIVDRYAYVGGEGSMQVVDISDPSSMFIQGCASTIAYDVVVEEDLVYLAAGSYGLRVYPAQCPATMAIGDPASAVPPSAFLAQNHPNPFARTTSISFAMPEVAGGGSLAVFDVLGRQVRVLAGGKMPVGRHAVTWDGRDSQGARVPAGVYFYRLTAGTAQEEKKMVVLSAP